MKQDDIDNFREYELKLRILNVAGQAAEDVDTIVEIKENIDILTKEKENLALRMFEEGQL